MCNQFRLIVVNSPFELARLFLFLPINRLLVFCIWGLLALPLSITGQETFNFTNLNQQNGLASDAILSILQDDQGFIWIGTENGLTRFDGQNFLRFGFDPEDNESLTGNSIYAIFEDGRQRLWVGTLNGLNLMIKSSGKFKRIPVLDQEGEEIIVRVNEIYEDHQNNIWITTDNNGLFKLRDAQAIDHILAVPFAYQTDSLSSNKPVEKIEIRFAEGEYLWISTQVGIDRLHIPSGKTEHFLFPGNENTFVTTGPGFNDLLDGKGNIFFNRERQIYFLDINDTDRGIRPFEDYFSEHPFKPSPFPGGAKRMEMEGDHKLILASREGLMWLDLLTGESNYLDEKIFNKQIFSYYQTNNILLDDQDNIWFGTYGGGLTVGWERNNFINFYENDPEDPTSITSGQIRSLLKDDQGNLWVATLRSGLDKCTLGQNGRLERIQSFQTLSGVPNELRDVEIIQLTKDQEGKIWISTSRKGLYRVDPLTLQFEHFYNDEQTSPASSISENRVWGLEVDPSNKIWVGTWSKGLNYLDPESGQIKYYTAGQDNRHSLLSNYIRTLYLESDSILWIGARDGLSRMNIQEGTFTHFTNAPENPNSLSNNLIWCIFQDRQGDLWIGTNVGLNRFNRQTGQFERFFESSGLPNNTIYGMQEDLNGTLWIATQNGLAIKLPNQTKTAFQPIISSDGLQSSEFLPKAHFLDEQTGVLYFGTVKGMVSINPEFSKYDDWPFKPDIHSISILNFSDTEKKEAHYYFLNGEEKQLTLGHKDKIIEITLADLSWDLGTKYTYEYYLSNFSNQWLEMGQEMLMTFTNLAAGRYSLLVRRKSLDQTTSSEVELALLKVLPPWWKTWWAYSLYFIAAVSMIISLYRYQLNRQLQRQETENLKALDAFKNELYTNITHEFRTPLTVISGMADQIVEPVRTKELIKRNSLSLLNLVNQILDLRKMELGKLKLDLVQANVIQYLRYILASYEAMADLKGVHLHFLPKEKELFMDFDQEKLLRIVSNLLSNAIKYTPEGGNVYLILEKSAMEKMPGQKVEALYLRVSDTGIGIPIEKQAYIFDRFYQVQDESDDKKYRYDGPGLHLGKSSSGIGLSLTRDLVTLMGGSISLKSAPDKGASFTVLLPISREAATVDVEQQTVEELSTAEHDLRGMKNEIALLSTKASSPEKSNNLSLLIIEDNADVQEYLMTLLESKYNLYLASDGQEGIEMAFDHIPDLIISDVMMPKKDGLEVCDTLKKDDRTSHIPIILLTAKASVESRIQGLERGADAYLAKPFNEKELFIRLEKLAELRRLLQQRYQHIHPPPADAVVQTAEPSGFEKEDAFMSKLMKTVEEHLDDTNFGPNQLCKSMSMSRSQLHLKIKALTNRSTSIFIRTIRLHKAKELLQKGELNVTQVAHEVGIESLSYFSRIFSEEFGVSPQQIISS